MIDEVQALVYELMRLDQHEAAQELVEAEEHVRALLRSAYIVIGELNEEGTHARENIN